MFMGFLRQVGTRHRQHAHFRRKLCIGVKKQCNACFLSDNKIRPLYTVTYSRYSPTKQVSFQPTCERSKEKANTKHVFGNRRSLLRQLECRLVYSAWSSTTRTT